MSRGRGNAEYKAWQAMIRRCIDPRYKNFASYGGRGINVCEAWRHDFVGFYEHVGPRPTPKHSLDRIDVDKGYEPGNVRWATRIEQENNKRDTRIVFYNGEEMPFQLFMRKINCGLNQQTVWNRIARNGWSVERAISEPVRAGRVRDR